MVWRDDAILFRDGDNFVRGERGQWYGEGVRGEVLVVF